MRAVVGKTLTRGIARHGHAGAMRVRAAFPSCLVSRRVCIDCTHVKRALGRRRRPTDRRTDGWMEAASKRGERAGRCVASRRVGQQLYSQLIMPAIDQRRDLGADAGGESDAGGVCGVVSDCAD